MAIDYESILYRPLFAVFGAEEKPVYSLAGGGSQDLDGIFNTGPIDINLTESAATADSRPTFTCLFADLPVGASINGDALTIDGTVYAVAELPPADHAGKVVIVLGASS